MRFRELGTPQMPFGLWTRLGALLDQFAVGDTVQDNECPRCWAAQMRTYCTVLYCTVLQYLGLWDGSGIGGVLVAAFVLAVDR
jgi:hypothetical protein